MIKSFHNRHTENLFKGQHHPHLPAELQRSALRKLLILDAAASPEDLRVPPGNRLEKLRGDREGQYSIHINDRYRLCFVWQDGDAYEVEIVDHH